MGTEALLSASVPVQAPLIGPRALLLALKESCNGEETAALRGLIFHPLWQSWCPRAQANAHHVLSLRDNRAPPAVQFLSQRFCLFTTQQTYKLLFCS